MNDIQSWSQNKKERFLDKIMSEVFVGKKAGFYAPLMLRLHNGFSDEIPTACTDGTEILFNLGFMVSLSNNLRLSVFMHELMHVANLHMVRRGTRDPELWNIACDYKINLDLKDEGYEIGHNWLIDERYRGLSEEEIYKLIEHIKPPVNKLGNDIKESQDKKDTIVNNVIKAIQQSKMGNSAGNVPNGIEEYIRKLITPIVPWQAVLQSFFTDLVGVKTTWRRPNRRYSSIYMPSRKKDIGKLKKINFYRDTSSSISNADNMRVSSEMYYIWTTFKPNEMNIIQFDCIIQKENLLKDRRSFDDFMVRGRGGTSLECVRNHILKTKPTVAVIFSDMECNPMNPTGIHIPIIWIRIGSGGHIPTFGKTVSIPRRN